LDEGVDGGVLTAITPFTMPGNVTLEIQLVLQPCS
jgi:hypothetical protein